jgi:hypothetical protein
LIVYNDTTAVMSQLSFGDAEYAGKRKQTRREVSIMSYSDVRVVTGQDAAKLADLYRRRR